MGKGGSTLLSICCQESPRVALTYPEEWCRLRNTPLPFQDCVHNAQPGLFFHGQCQSFHQLTFSLISYLLTKLMTNDK
jgi:hypothetical protein